MNYKTETRPLQKVVQAYTVDLAPFPVAGSSGRARTGRMRRSLPRSGRHDSTRAQAAQPNVCACAEMLAARRMPPVIPRITSLLTTIAKLRTVTRLKETDQSIQSFQTDGQYKKQLCAFCMSTSALLSQSGSLATTLYHLCQSCELAFMFSVPCIIIELHGHLCYIIGQYGGVTCTFLNH